MTIQVFKCKPNAVKPLQTQSQTENALIETDCLNIAFDNNETDERTSIYHLIQQNCSEITKKSTEVHTRIHSLKQKFTTKSIFGPHLNNGISLLDTQSILLLQYLQHLSLIALHRLSNQPFTSHTAQQTVEQSTAIRTIFEKTRPIEKKLKYRIDRLLQNLTGSDAQIQSAQTQVKDPLAYSSNIAALINQDRSVADSNEAETEPSSEKPQSSVYRPPALALNEYEANEKLIQKQRKDALRSRSKLKTNRIASLMRELNDDRPEEIGYSCAGDREMDDSDLERQQFEEDNMIRLPVTRKDKAKAAAKARRNHISNIDDFSDLKSIVYGSASGTTKHQPSIIEEFEAIKPGKKRRIDDDKMRISELFGDVNQIPSFKKRKTSKKTKNKTKGKHRKSRRN